MFRLRVESGARAGETTSLAPGKAYVIGRSREVDVRFPEDGTMSREHGQLVWEGNAWIVKNKSQHGLLVGDAKVDTERRLAPGDILTLGGTRFVFEVDPEGGAAPVSPATPAQAPATPGAKEPSTPAPLPRTVAAGATPGAATPAGATPGGAGAAKPGAPATPGKPGAPAPPKDAKAKPAAGGGGGKKLVIIAAILILCCCCCTGIGGFIKRDAIKKALGKGGEGE